MRVGIITIQKCDNFGADLQAYALGAKLRSMGYDAENIDYLFYKHQRHLGGRGERPVLPISIKNKIKEFLFPIVTMLKSLKNRVARAERHRRFDAWFNMNVKVGQEYRSVKSLYDNPPKYDVYMVGSDQVWNPRLYSNIKPYFLDFVPQRARCVSYASSFGVSELSGPVFYKYKQWLKKFSHIGLREKKGADIVDAMALNAEVAHVLDPTLLLTANDWEKVAIRPEDAPTCKYLLLYDLIASQETVDLARQWAEQEDWRVVRIGDGAYGPGEFAWLFAHAQSVVTNSFHGTAFAILNHKPFYSVVPRGMTNASRIESLLDTISLRHRLFQATDVAEISINDELDWGAVDDRLNDARDKSVGFLRRSVDGNPNLISRADVKFSLPRASYAVWHADEKVRANSTSGGAFSVLASEVRSKGGIVYGAAWSDDFKSVRHIGVTSLAELPALRQSKYVESDAGDAIKDAKVALSEGRDVLFCGTPCQCAAMRAAAKDIDEKLVLADFVCHGTPIVDVWKSYVEGLEKKCNGKLARYEFRNKDKGWNFQNIVYEFENGVKKRVIPWLDPYFHGFSINAFLRDGCYKCPFAQLKRISDFTIADCWRVAASNPEYDDNKGTSLVLVNTDKAKTLWKKLLSDNVFAGGEYDIDLAQSRNMALMHPPAKPGCREVFMKIFKETGSFDAATKCYLSWEKTLKYTLLYWVKRVGWFYFKHHQ